MPPHRLLVFGASGAIGGAIAQSALQRQWHVTGVTRTLAASAEGGLSSLVFDPFAPDADPDIFREQEPFDAVCWAQGANTNDSVYDVDLDRHAEIYRANCTYILATSQLLLRLDKLRAPARLCIISSIWQNLARQSKLTYCMTKAALQGLVLSASADLAADGHLVNAVLPGALETPMTRRNLSQAQIDTLTSATRFGRLSTLDDVASAVLYLCSPENTGITGQFVAADLGFSHVRIV